MGNGFNIPFRGIKLPSNVNDASNGRIGGSFN